jgi:hypothetical protein
MVEMAQHDDLDEETAQRSTCQRDRQRQQETAARRHYGCGHVGADHVKRAVRKVDQVHHAENQRQSRRQQEQHEAQLQAV